MAFKRDFVFIISYLDSLWNVVKNGFILKSSMDLSVHSPLNKSTYTNHICKVFYSEHGDIKEDYLQESQVPSTSQEEHKEEEEVTPTLTYDISNTINKIDK